MKFMLLLLIVFSQCDFNRTVPIVTEAAKDSIVKHNDTLVAYDSFLKNYREKTAGLSQNENAKHFFDAMYNHIPDYWIGTTWDFNGTSTVPQEGTIACGYFVTNVLSQLGFRINRVKLAQQASSVMIKQLCVNIYRTTSFDDLVKHLKQFPDSSVFIIGLDFHTGFIVKENDENIYFLHSSYINNIGVVKEDIYQSEALWSRNYMVGRLEAGYVE